MTIAALLALVAQYGPTIVPLVAKLVADVNAGRGEEQLKQADWDELARLSGLSGADIYARLGIALPPATPKP